MENFIKPTAAKRLHMEKSKMTTHQTFTAIYVVAPGFPEIMDELFPILFPH